MRIFEIEWKTKTNNRSQSAWTIQRLLWYRTRDVAIENKILLRKQKTMTNTRDGCGRNGGALINWVSIRDFIKIKIRTFPFHPINLISFLVNAWPVSTGCAHAFSHRTHEGNRIYIFIWVWEPDIIYQTNKRTTRGGIGSRKTSGQRPTQTIKLMKCNKNKNPINRIRPQIIFRFFSSLSSFFLSQVRTKNYVWKIAFETKN